MAKFPPKKGSAGYTLVELLVSVSVLGTLIIVLSVLLIQFGKSARAIGRLYAIEQVRFTLRMGLNCTNTVAAAPPVCPPGTSVPLLSSTGLPFTNIGDYQLRGSCETARNRYNIEFSRDGIGWAPLFKMVKECRP